MDFHTVKTCFEKYTSYLKEHEGINLPESFNIESMTIHEMDTYAQVLFMDYVLKCEDKVNQFSISCTLYKHVNSLIRQYIQDLNQTRTDTMKSQIIKLEDENKQLKHILLPSANQLETKLTEPPKLELVTDISNEKDSIKSKSKSKSKGWFY